jgi:hypothetical protein
MWLFVIESFCLLFSTFSLSYKTSKLIIARESITSGWVNIRQLSQNITISSRLSTKTFRLIYSANLDRMKTKLKNIYRFYTRVSVDVFIPLEYLSTSQWNLSTILLFEVQYLICTHNFKLIYTIYTVVHVVAISITSRSSLIQFKFYGLLRFPRFNKFKCLCHSHNTVWFLLNNLKNNTNTKR